MEKSTFAQGNQSTYHSLAEVYNYRASYNDPNSKKPDDTTRRCVNAGCGETFTHSDNLNGDLCLCHPGYWDFGHTGLTMQQAYNEYQQKYDTDKIERQMYDKAYHKLKEEIESNKYISDHTISKMQ